jgi:hypothetical protein
MNEGISKNIISHTSYYSTAFKSHFLGVLCMDEQVLGQL